MISFLSSLFPTLHSKTKNSSTVLYSRPAKDAQKWETLFHYGPFFRDYYSLPRAFDVMTKQQTLLPLNKEQKFFVKELAVITWNKLREKDDDPNIDTVNTYPDIWGMPFLENFLLDFNQMASKKIPMESLINLDLRPIIQLYLAGDFKQTFNLEEEKKYRYAYLNKEEVMILNPITERPKIFFGKGPESKLNGRLKRQVLPEQMEINISKNLMPPEISKKRWKKVIEDKTMFWTVHWRDPITKKQKYIWLDNTSRYKQQRDLYKFNFAYSLNADIKKVRKTYLFAALNGENEQIRQIGTCIYLIDKFGFRLGTTNETTIDNPEKDALGIVQIRVSHITFKPNNTIVIDFIGKDKVRYFGEHEVNDKIYANLKAFTKNKNPKQKLFNQANSTLVNAFLNNIKEGLTSKILRTFRASYEFQKLLNDIKLSRNPEIAYMQIKIALIEIAKITNHVQVKNAKSFEKYLGKIQARLVSSRLTSEARQLLLLKEEFLQKSRTRFPNYFYQINTLLAAYIDPRIYLSKLKTANLPLAAFFTPAESKSKKWALDYVQNNSPFAYPV